MGGSISRVIRVHAAPVREPDGRVEHIGCPAGALIVREGPDVVPPAPPLPEPVPTQQHTVPVQRRYKSPSVQNIPQDRGAAGPSRLVASAGTECPVLRPRTLSIPTHTDIYTLSPPDRHLRVVLVDPVPCLHNHVEHLANAGTWGRRERAAGDRPCADEGCEPSGGVGFWH